MHNEMGLEHVFRNKPVDISLNSCPSRKIGGRFLGVFLIKVLDR